MHSFIIDETTTAPNIANENLVYGVKVTPLPRLATPGRFGAPYRAFPLIITYTPPEGGLKQIIVFDSKLYKFQGKQVQIAYGIVSDPSGQQYSAADTTGATIGPLLVEVLDAPDDSIADNSPLAQSGAVLSTWSWGVAAGDEADPTSADPDPTTGTGRTDHCVPLPDAVSYQVSVQGTVDGNPIGGTLEVWKRQANTGLWSRRPDLDVDLSGAAFTVDGNGLNAPTKELPEVDCNDLVGPGVYQNGIPDGYWTFDVLAFFGKGIVSDLTVTVRVWTKQDYRPGE